MADNADYDLLLKAAADARSNSYSPYSHFRIGAALMSVSGKVYTGCNIENIAYSPTICAERVALGSAIASGEKPGSFTAIAIVGDDPKPSTPCGMCRQILMELAREATVIMSAAPEKGSDRLIMRVEELLPHGFKFDANLGTV